MPTPGLQKERQRLVERFSAAEAAITSVIASALVGGLSAKAMRSALSEISAVIGELMGEVVRWTEVVVPRIYRAGLERASASMGLPDHPAALRRLTSSQDQRQSLQALGEALVEDMAAATDNMSKDAKRVLRQIGATRQREAMARVNPRAAVSDFASEMEESGLAFVDRARRRWDPRDYAEMALRAQTGSILNAASVNAAIELGSPGVRVFDGTEDDDACREANGQTWSLAVAGANLIEHPNCVRAFSPLPASRSVTLDRE